MSEFITYVRFYHAHGMCSSDNRQFDNAEDALAYATVLVKDGNKATIFHLDRQWRGE